MNIQEYSTLEWDDFYNLIFSHFEFNFKSIDEMINKIEIHNDKIQWLELKEWENLDDIEIYNTLEKLETPEDEIFVISEISYIKETDPFRLKSSCLRKFIMQYLSRFHECFFNGDVLIFSIRHKLIWLFHHEGVYALVRLK
jgi:hypothetical protein